MQIEFAAFWEEGWAGVCGKVEFTGVMCVMGGAVVHRGVLPPGPRLGSNCVPLEVAKEYR